MDFLGYSLAYPAYCYLIFSITLIIFFTIIKLAYSVIFQMNVLQFIVIKLLFLVFFVFLLNLLFNSGYQALSWGLMVILILGWFLFGIIPNLFPNFSFLK